MTDKYLTVSALRALVNAIPTTRDNDSVAVYDLNKGLRFDAIHLDTDCSGVVELNFELNQYEK